MELAASGEVGVREELEALEALRGKGEALEALRGEERH